MTGQAVSENTEPLPPEGPRVESERFKKYTYEELIERDKVSLDVFWLRDESLEGADNLAAPDVIAAEIVDDLEAALEEFRALVESLADVGVDLDEVVDTGDAE